MAIRALGAKMVGKQICLEDLCMIDIKCSEPRGHFDKVEIFPDPFVNSKTFNSKPRVNV